MTIFTFKLVGNQNPTQTPYQNLPQNPVQNITLFSALQEHGAPFSTLTQRKEGNGASLLQTVLRIIIKSIVDN